MKQMKYMAFGLTLALGTGMGVFIDKPAVSQPLPESLRSAIATFTPVNNQVTVELKNETGATLTYEVLGITDQRLLLANESVTLQNLPLTATLTAVRQDNGLIDITAAAATPGTVEISITQEFNFDDTQGVITLDANGRIFAN